MYPNLIYKTKKYKKVMGSDIISDLKLDSLLGKNASEILLEEPDSQNILARQEIFSKLRKNPEKSQNLQELSDMLEKANNIYSAMEKSKCENAKFFMFVSLAKTLCDFIKKASEKLDLGELFERFNSFFETECKGQEFNRLQNSAEILSGYIASMKILTLKINGENMVVERYKNTGGSDELLKCASAMNIALRPAKQRNIALQDSIIDALAALFPREFEEMSIFYTDNKAKISPEIFAYIPEIQFILEINKLTADIEAKGIPLSFPSISEYKKIEFKDVYDVTLIRKSHAIVPNDVTFDTNEPFFYLTGANGGGKTTYLRAVGISVLMFLAGCPVCCKSGECCVLDSIFTHFPKDERFEGSGRFFDEVKRVDYILENQNGNSLILLNETYSTTNEDKAIEHTNQLAQKISKSGNLGIYITHQHGVDESEIPFLGVVTDPLDQNRRTYLIERKRSAHKSFASDILKKYGLTDEKLRQRFNLTNYER